MSSDGADRFPVLVLEASGKQGGNVRKTRMAAVAALLTGAGALGTAGVAAASTGADTNASQATTQAAQPTGQVTQRPPLDQADFAALMAYVDQLAGQYPNEPGLARLDLWLHTVQTSLYQQAPSSNAATLATDESPTAGQMNDTGTGQVGSSPAPVSPAGSSTSSGNAGPPSGPPFGHAYGYWAHHDHNNAGDQNGTAGDDQGSATDNQASPQQSQPSDEQNDQTATQQENQASAQQDQPSDQQNNQGDSGPQQQPGDDGH